MQNLYREVNTLDRRAVEKFALSETIMMEHAALSMAQLIRTRFEPNASILIVCGNGNNGADGRILARQLEEEYCISLHYQSDTRYDVIVDALFGSGLNRAIDRATGNLLDLLNASDAFKIACDVPSGLFAEGTLDPHTFKADITITMGGLKRSLFSDAAKEYTGEIHVANLGISRSRYEIPSSWQLLDPTDLSLPLRTKASTHKGSYGHLALICGEKVGAAVIAGSAALRFGTGLVSLLSNENVFIPYELMQNHSLPETTTAIAVGMGLGVEFCDDELTCLLDNTLPLVLDADIFYHPLFVKLLKRGSIVLTPHPKEFTQILRICGIADINTETLQNDRFGYVEQFCSAFPDIVLLLKGANVIIGSQDNFYINPHGTVALAKGGSGDVLSGLIGALLAQGHTPLEAAIQGSLAHTLASQKLGKNNYALSPFDLIERITHL
ncbi:MAG: NAD(P)H-hydrate dehydratase [Sulfuricurvum sp.]|uniref:NAD(P)H-hydrate dehydratase n=1 Tax=Sulfuricurvum sp. TaxID=2025608 RepID=UPI00262D6B7B|nr:NAD(P)H-hydrate dehydratase [Sulfuricurvum sp.]MDD5161006.1 NAD(P)H-hydrate dehydratase [Sulfuricurvum sp.]